MTTPTGPRPWPEHWAIFAAAEADRIGHQARVARPEPVVGRAAASLQAIEHHLAEARRACHCPSRRRFRRRGLADRWRGASVEQAFRNLHAAKEFLVDLLPQAEVDALVPDVMTRISSALNRGDPRRSMAVSALRSRQPAVRRAALKQAMASAYEASDDEYSRLRDFRNIIVLTTIGLTLFLGVLLAVVNHYPKAIPLCFEPSVTTAATGSQEQVTTVCPSGDRQQPTGGDVLILAGLGAVGGGLGALFAIRNLRGTSTPYGIPTALALLKVPAGALTAVIGVLLLAGGFVPGLSNLDSQRQILAYGLLFGYAQQLITRLVDNQGQQLLERVPSKDSQSEQPSVAVHEPGVVATDAGPDRTGTERAGTERAGTDTAGAYTGAQAGTGAGAQAGTDTGGEPGGDQMTADTGAPVATDAGEQAGTTDGGDQTRTGITADTGEQAEGDGTVTAQGGDGTADTATPEARGTPDVTVPKARTPTNE